MIDHKNFLPTAPAQMTEQHLNNSVAFHMRQRDDFTARITTLKDKVAGHSWALQQLYDEGKARARKAQHAKVIANVVARYGLDPAVFAESAEQALMDRITALEAKVETLSKRKRKR